MSQIDRNEILNQVRIATAIETINVTDANIVTMINQGVYEIGIADEWPWLEETATISLVDSQQTYSLPNDFDRWIALVDDDYDTTIPYISPATFLKEFGNDTGNESTVPDFWTIYESKIYLSPIPESNDTDRLTLYYYKDEVTLDAGGDSPPWHAAFHWALVEYCKWKLWDHEEYFDQSERAFITYSRYLEDMRNYYSTKGRRYPMIAGDGSARRPDDPNLPWLYRI